MLIRILGYDDTTRTRNLLRHLRDAGHEVGGIGRPEVVVVAGWKPWLAARSRMRSRVIVDHFIPLYEKYIEDHQRWSPRSPRALILRMMDASMCWSAHAVLVDTDQHADFLARLSRRPRSAFHVYPPSTGLPPPTAPAPPIDVVWIGHGAPFHAVDLIREAVASMGASSLISTSIDPADAANLLASAKVALGVFGADSPKAHRVVPYKVLDAMALGVPVITLRTESTASLDGVMLVDSIDELPSAIRELLADEPLRKRMGDAGRLAYVERFGDEAQTARLSAILASL